MQTDVYEGTAKPLLKNLLDGYNATIFAYGVSIDIVPLCSSEPTSFPGDGMWKDAYYQWD